MSNKKDHETSRIIGFWERRESVNFHYFNVVDNDDATSGFWDSTSPFRRAFDQLDLTAVLEIACGFGRHSQRIAKSCGRLWLLDTSIDALEEARRRFQGYPNVEVLPPGQGNNIGLENDSCTAVFSYDAMVHFEMNDVFSYLREAFRVLKVGGRLLLHHSAYELAPGNTFDQNPGWRNFMNLQTFKHVALQSGFRIISVETLDWNAPKSDALTLLEKV